MRLMEGEHIGPFNLGNPGEFTMLELAKVSFSCNFYKKKNSFLDFSTKRKKSQMVENNMS